ncbi:DivIVA domain-containing protein [Weissella soli]|uniref:DivIVA domain-containing protein n=1 Tax=Weissella soli TaxID=155866 RepID=UPI0021C1435A|nr:DivIVA domain-containing protein [Weissella soli]
MLTPQEIHAKEFSGRGRNYDKAEVNEFLDQVVIDFETVTEENKTLKTKLAEADAAAKQVEDMKQSVNASILIAQEAADRLKKQTESEVAATLQQAQVEAQKIVMEATAKANNITSESQQVNAALVEEKQVLTADMGNFKNKLTSLLQAQLDLINNSSEWAEYGAKPAEAEVTPAALEAATEDSAESVEASSAVETVVVFPEKSNEADKFLNNDEN